MIEGMSNSEAVSLLMNSQYYKQGYKQGTFNVLNKIRVDIEHLPFTYDEIKLIIEIIDKYKAESEE